METIAKQRKELLINKIEHSLNDLRESTVQIFRIHGDEPEQVGTGFYLFYRERLFLISAAHVFDDAPQNERWIYDDKGDFQKIIGVFYKHKTIGKRDDDLKDIIAIDTIGFSPKNPFQTDMVDFDSGYKKGIYGFIGYPGTKNGLKFGKKEFKNRSYSYYDMSLQAKDITYFQYDDNLNILIRYQYKGTIIDGVGPLRSPKMKGISGGPVFWISPLDNLLSWDKCQIKLAGVVFHTMEKPQYMAGVRFTILIDVLDGRSSFQDEFDIFEVT